MEVISKVPQSVEGMKERLTSSEPPLVVGVNNPINCLSGTLGVEAPSFSFFRHPVTNVHPSKVLTVFEAYELITNESYQPQVDTLRAIANKAEAGAYKKATFDFITFSGIFTYRNASSLMKHSEFLTLDFDAIQQLDELKQALLNDDRFDTVLLFVSPSGNGLKWIISIDTEQASHLEWFEVAAECIKESYQLDVDPSGKDICRACFLSYDPSAYINPAYMPHSFNNQII